MDKARVIAGVALLAFATSAEAKVFRIGGVTPDGVEMIDAASLKRTGDTVQGSSLLIRLTPDGQSYDYVAFVTQWDCAGLRVKQLSGEGYHADGERVAARMPPQDWTDVRPSSAGGGSLKAACAQPSDPMTIMESESNATVVKTMSSALLKTAKAAAVAPEVTR